MLKNETKVRISGLVHKNVKFKTRAFETEIPTICLEIDTWKIFSFYREWSKAGDVSTNSITDQQLRLEDFCKTFKKEKGKKILLGDTNINFLPSDTDHYRRLEPLKEILLDTMVTCGMVQIIHQPTRVQGLNSACLDHIYISNRGCLLNLTLSIYSCLCKEA